MTRLLPRRAEAEIRGLLRRHARLAGLAEETITRVPVVWDIAERVARRDAGARYRAWTAEYDTIVETDAAAMRARQAELVDRPLLSIVLAVSGMSQVSVDAVVRSLREQPYEQWEAWLAGERTCDGPADERVRCVAEGCATPAEALNSALESATGEVAVFLEPAVVLRPHALFLVATAFREHPGAVLVYADEDQVDEEDRRFGHHFKPDWNEELLCAQNYLGGLVAFRRSLALEAGGFSDEPDGEHAWALWLRLTAGAGPDAVRHLPFVLSHRTTRASTDMADVSPVRALRAHESRLASVGRQTALERAGGASYRVRYMPPRDPPAVTVLVPSTARPDLLRRCIRGLLTETAYPDLDVVVMVDEKQRSMPERRELLDSLGAQPRASVRYYRDRPFNYSWVNNWAASEARGELLCFFNDDVEVVRGDWLQAMVGHAVRDGVAAVGALLLFPNGRVQHAGVVLGLGGIAGHAFRGRRTDDPGYHDRAVVAQDVSCVTAACMVVRRTAFADVGGFDEELGHAFNDVDLCLRLRQAGWRIVWTPAAVLRHRESASGRHNAPERREQWDAHWRLMQERWGEELRRDPHYNPNVLLDALRLWEPAFPPRIAYPWRTPRIDGR